MKEHEKHVKNYGSTSYCGRTLYSWYWYFQSKEHAFNSVEQNTRLQPCPKCLKSIQNSNTQV